MAKTVLFGAAAAAVITADRYGIISGRALNTSTTETRTQVTFNQGGTISNLFVNVSANTTTACSFYVRQNAGNTAVTVAYTSGQTGLKEDLVNSFTVSAGDEINYFYDITSGSSITLQVIACVFNSSSNSYSIFTCNSDGTAQNDNLTRYQPFGQLGDAQATETDAQLEMLTAGSFKHLFVNVITNTHTTAATDVFLSIDASTSGCPTVQYLATVTGFKEDTTTTKAISDGAKACFKTVTAANAGTTATTFTTMSIGFYTFNGKQQFGSAISATSQNFNITNYWNIHGIPISQTTESYKQYTSMVGDINCVELCTEVTANTIATSATTFDLRVNTGGNTLQISYAAGVTGTKSTTGGTRVINGDEIDFRCVTPNTSGAITFQQMSLLYEQMPQFWKTNRINLDEIDEGEEIG